MGRTESVKKEGAENSIVDRLIERSNSLVERANRLLEISEEVLPGLSFHKGRHYPAYFGAVTDDRYGGCFDGPYYNLLVEISKNQISVKQPEMLDYARKLSRVYAERGESRFTVKENYHKKNSRK